jgi:hypothetical protein
MDDDETAGAGGAESAFYRQRGYRCKNKPMEELEELLLVAGIDDQAFYGPALAEVFAKAAPPQQAGPAVRVAQDAPPGLVGMLRCGGDAGVNLNTAPRAVLETLPIRPEAVEQIIAYRRFDADSSGELSEHAFTKIEDIDQLQGLSDADRAVLRDIGRFSSDCVRVFVVARHKPTGLRVGLEVLLDLSEGSAKVARWKEATRC